MMRTILVRLAIAGLCLFAIARAASANVIYDVVIQYEVGQNTYSYSFSMEFANASGAKTQSHLVGGDFFGEAFSGPDGNWTLTSDFDTGSLDFDADTLVLSGFLTTDRFDSPSAGAYTSEIGYGSFQALSASGDFSGEAFSRQVTMRSPAMVPVAPTAALILAGLVAWRLRAVAAAASRATVGRIRA